MRCAGFRRLTDQRGVIGILGVGMYSAIVVVIAAAMVTTSVINYRISNQRVGSVQSLYHAESGTEDALLQMKRNASYGSTSTTLTTTFSDTDRVETVVETVSTESCESAKQVTASGFVRDLVRRIQVSNCPIPSVEADFAYALQAGAGGIHMNNNAIIHGSSYSNGDHVGNNGAQVTGDVWVAGGAALEATPEHVPSDPLEFVFGRSTNPDVIDVAQRFKPDTSASDKLIKVGLLVRKFGNPANATVRIVRDAGGEPSGDQVASGTLSATSVGNTLQYIQVSLSNPPTLDGGQDYWIVIDTSGSPSNYWAWGGQDGYPDGHGMFSDRWRSNGNHDWEDADLDFGFKAFMGSPPTRAERLEIGGDVHAHEIKDLAVTGDAYYQVDDGSSVGGTRFPDSEDPPQKDLPITEANLVDFKNQAAAGATHTGDYTIPLGQTRTIGPMKIEGNLNVENGATLIMTGTIWTTGTILFSNNVNILLHPDYGGSSGAIVADGQVTISNNVEFEGSGDPNSFLLLATSDASGNAIHSSNNSDSIVLAAPFGTIQISNNGGANALTAQRLQLNNNATITYLTGLADIDFSAGPGGSFSAGGWQEVVCDTADGPCQPAT